MKSTNLGNALTCYSCDSVESCRNANTQECSNETALENNAMLSTIFQDLPYVNNISNFECFNLTYICKSQSLLDFVKNILSKLSLTANQTLTELRGCIFPDVKVCDQFPLTSYFGYNFCYTCNWNYCNRNPAGTFSKSTFTIIASAITLIFTKRLR